MNRAIFPGSFDPITNGHLDIIKRASALFDELYVVILENSEKKSTFSIDERIGFIKHACASYTNVFVKHDTCLTVVYARKKEANAIIRGVRSVKDYEYERDIASINQHLAPEIETVLLFCSPEQSFVSSSMIRELASYGQDISSFVIDEIVQAYKKKLNK